MKLYFAREDHHSLTNSSNMVLHGQSEKWALMDVSLQWMDGEERCHQLHCGTTKEKLIRWYSSKDLVLPGLQLGASISHLNVILLCLENLKVKWWSLAKVTCSVISKCNVVFITVFRMWFELKLVEFLWYLMELVRILRTTRIVQFPFHIPLLWVELEKIWKSQPRQSVEQTLRQNNVTTMHVDNRHCFHNK